MSRHRIIRSMDYSEEYEGYDDVYGHSVDDDNCISPTDAQEWIYNRSKEQCLMSSFLQNDIVNDSSNRKNNKNNGNINTKSNGDVSSKKAIKAENLDTELRDNNYEHCENLNENYKLPKLNETEQEQLITCIEGVRNVVGDTITEQCIVETAIRFHYNIERVLDDILNEECSNKLHLQPQLSTTSSSSLSTTKAINSNKKNPNLSNANPLKLASNELNEKKVTKNDLNGTVWVTTASQKDMKRGFEVNELTSQPSLMKDGVSSVITSGDDKANISKTTQNIVADIPSNQNIQFKVSKEQSKRDNKKMYDIERNSKKQHLNMIVIGHVDAGKSTLMGHLLYATGNVSQRLMHKYEQESKKIGKQSFMYAWVLDETSEERTRGM